jgi:hypothetical protein
MPIKCSKAWPLIYDDDPGDKIISTTVATALTDHLAIILLIDLPIPVLRRSRSEWKLNARFLRDRGSNEGFNALKETWKGGQARYADLNLWWME